MPFYCLPGRAEAQKGEDVGQVCLCYRMLHQGVGPVYRSPLLSASGEFVFAATPEAPPGSKLCSAGS